MTESMMLFAELDFGTAIVGVLSGAGGFLVALTTFRNGEAARYQAICDKAIEMHARCEDHVQALYSNQEKLWQVCKDQNESLARIGGKPVTIPPLEPAPPTVVVKADSVIVPP